MARLAPPLLCALAAALFATLLLKHLSYPLLWHDEAETAVFSQRVLEHGYPVVRDGRNTVYSLWHRGGVGVDERSGAWTGTPWAQYYFGALGVALGSGAADLYTRTLLLRLPFALAGALGVVLLGLAVLPAVGGGRGRRLGFAALYLLLISYSVSLLLHLREARYYPLVILVSGAALLAFTRRHPFGRLGFGAYAAGLSLALVLLFNTFYPAFTAFVVAMGLHLALRARGRGVSLQERGRWLLRESTPLLLAGGVALALLGFFDFFEQARGWVARFAASRSYLANLGSLAVYLLRHEFLAPALALRVTVVVLRPGAEPLAGDAPLRQRLELARLLLLLVCVYALLVAQTPFLFARYFVVLSPLVTLLLLLDAFSAYDLLRPRAARVRGPGLAALALAGACFAAVAALRIPEMAGRLHEIRHRYQGPLDFVIPHLAERYPRPAELVIATNYEGPSYMFYLGSRVTVGFYGADLERDLELTPDVIVPRPWPDHLELLRELSEQASYRTVDFPVANLRWNNVPALPTRSRPLAHQFRTPDPGQGGPGLVILEREAPEPGG